VKDDALVAVYYVNGKHLACGSADMAAWRRLELIGGRYLEEMQWKDAKRKYQGIQID
jgi:hypothetical protein